MNTKPVIAVCGKGGVGKTAVSALLSRVLIQEGIKPLLLIDADPVGGLVMAVGEQAATTLTSVRERLIVSARNADDAEKKQLAQEIDYLVMEALVERKDYALLAMGYNEKSGCFCPANILLREAIDLIAASFEAVLIDAEAGLEQINRQVTRRVNKLIIVSDGSYRSIATLRVIMDRFSPDQIALLANRSSVQDVEPLPEGKWAGVIPEDRTLRQFDRNGRSLWELPPENEALIAMTGIARSLGLLS